MGAWLMNKERCVVRYRNEKGYEYGYLAQVNGDVSCVDLDNGERVLRENSDIAVQRDSKWMWGRG
jgi:hypothetical protein